MLLRYFSQVEQEAVAQKIAMFLTDKHKTVVFEALKALKNLSVKFDASMLLPYVQSMSEVEQEMAIDVLCAQADTELVPKLAPWTCGKSDETREVLIKLFLKHVTPEGLETFLILLDQQEWWGQEQALKCLQKFGNDMLYKAARGLTKHDNEFIREQAQKFAVQGGDPSDTQQLWKNAQHENWQVRESAIVAIGNSKQRESIGVLKEVVEKWPESATAVKPGYAASISAARSVAIWATSFALAVTLCTASASTPTFQISPLLIVPERVSDSARATPWLALPSGVIEAVWSLPYIDRSSVRCRTIATAPHAAASTDGRIVRSWPL
jgi:hypothetical protein